MTIEKAKAKKLFNESPQWFKEELISEFGEDFFKPLEYESIKTFEDACKKFKVHPDYVFTDRDSTDEIAYKKLKVIIAAINNGWKPDWSNSNQKKWWPWFNLSSGFGFSFSAYYGGYSSTTVGSRLCFESQEKSDYCATQFIDLYKDLLTL
ncbi:MAG: hypothetical protein EHM20_17495 [Alphaproteobacteria bacterium]|nr:MAG: hypothetical protein EHM20_17495 [Alphaproteobacteria bacterium]